MIKYKSIFSHSTNSGKKSINSAKKNPANSTKRTKKRQIGHLKNSYKLSFTTKVVLGLVMFVAAVTGIVTLAKAQMSISEKQKILDDLNTKIAQQAAENEELEQKLNGNLDEYIEDYARDKLDMVKPGEHVYINTVGD